MDGKERSDTRRQEGLGEGQTRVREGNGNGNGNGNGLFTSFLLISITPTFPKYMYFPFYNKKYASYYLLY
jgi:hypothetical protein